MADGRKHEREQEHEHEHESNENKKNCHNKLMNINAKVW